jgi:hypothetical protein
MRGVKRICLLVQDYELTMAQMKVRLRYEVGKELQWELEHGKCKGKFTKVAQLCFPAVQNITGRDNYSVAWFEECHKFYQRLTEDEIDMLVRKRVPHSYVRWIVLEVGQSQREAVLASIRNGKNKAPWKVPCYKKKNSAKVVRPRSRNEYLVSMQINGDESSDDIQAMMESLLSAAKRLGLDYENIVMAALERVRKMGLT